MKRRSKKHLLDLLEKSLEKDYMLKLREIPINNNLGEQLFTIDLLGITPARVDLYLVDPEYDRFKKEEVMKKLEEQKIYLQCAFPQPINCFYMTYDSRGLFMCREVIPSPLEKKIETGER